MTRLKFPTIKIFYVSCVGIIIIITFNIIGNTFNDLKIKNVSLTICSRIVDQPFYECIIMNTEFK